MVETTITQIFADNTIGISALYIAVAVVFLLFGIAFFSLILVNYKHNSNTKTWYNDQVYAFKAGYIQKKAKDMDIELVYPPKADFGQALEEEVSGDLNTP